MQQFTICAALHLLLFTVATFGRVAPGEHRSPLPHPNENSTETDDTKSELEKAEDLCVRTHNNTAFMGIEPFSRIRLDSASDCRKSCLETYPKCVGVMFYYVHSGDENQKHICYLFDKNSVNEEVALVPEKPSSPLDMVRALEVVLNCHEFDPVPPLEEHFVMSSDNVPLKKRDVGFDRPVVATGPWTRWSVCSPTNRIQLRTQPCEYGRLVQRRRCYTTAGGLGGSVVSAGSGVSGVSGVSGISGVSGVSGVSGISGLSEVSGTSGISGVSGLSGLTGVSGVSEKLRSLLSLGSVQPTASISISIPYPPLPYTHPSLQTSEYARIMAQHQEQMQKLCCYRQHYVHQQLQNQYQSAAAAGQQVHYAVPAVGVCAKPCAGQYRIVPPSSTGYQVTPTVSPGQYIAGGYQPGQAAAVSPAQYIAGEYQPAEIPTISPAQYIAGGYQGVQTTAISSGQYIAEDCQPGQTTAISPDQYVVGGYQPGQTTVISPTQYVSEGYQQPQPDQVITQDRQPATVVVEEVANQTVSHIPPTLRPSVRRPLRPGPRPVQPTAAPVWTEWTEWSACSATCDIGSQQRERKCESSTDAQCSGESVEWRRCIDLEPCKTWSHWTEWSTCRATCGMGERSRSRYCHVGEGLCDGSSFEAESCNTGVECAEWSHWEQWSACSATCGYGTKRRTRVCTGRHCPGDSYQQSDCENEPCSHWTNWQAWSSCSVSCGRGIKIRERLCIGSYCEGEASEQMECHEQPCATWSEWQSWSHCSATCGKGTQTRMRTCHGNFCLGKSVEQTLCEHGPCSSWSSWGDWDDCSCSTGTQTRSRTCMHGQECVGAREDTQQCDIRACAQWTPWGDWSTCDKDCGPGKKTRRRECVTSEGDASSRCEGDAVDHSVCLVQACCQWTTWNDWSSCDRDCGGGRITRSRMCLRPGTDDSSGCDCAGYDREQMSCNEHHCAPIPYEYEAEPEFPPESVYQPQPVTQPQLQTLPLTTIAPTHPGTQPAVIRKQLIHHHRPTPVYKPGPVIIPVRVPYYIKPVTRTEVGSTAATTGVSCQWSEWWGWNQHAGGDLRRSRACIGDNDCVCYGPAVQEAVCSECAENVECVEACKKK